MKRNIFFTGEMKEKFGDSIVLDTDSLQDLVRGIEANRPGFRKYIISLQERDLDIRVYNAGKYLTEEDGPLFPLEDGDVLLSVAPAGALFGITLLSIFSAIFTVAEFAIKSYITTKIIDGVAKLLAPDAEEIEEGEESYLFQGPQNRFLSGKTLPVVYGEMRVGGFPMNLQIVSSPFDSVEMSSDTEGNIYAGRE
jgi:predicted phage tail protein